MTDARRRSAYGISLGDVGRTGTTRVWNNIVYNFPVVTGSEGDCIDVYYGFGYLFNNTVYNCRDGIRKYNTASGAQVKNNVSINDVFNPAAFTDYRDLTVAPAATRVSNVSSDTTSETLALRSKTAYASYFKNTTAGTEDLHTHQHVARALGLGGRESLRRPEPAGDRRHRRRPTRGARHRRRRVRRVLRPLDRRRCRAARSRSPAPASSRCG